MGGNAHRIGEIDRAYLGVRPQLQYQHFDHVAFVCLFEALNVDGNTGSDLAFPIEPALDKESTGLLDCRWIEAQTPGGVRHIYAALRLRLTAAKTGAAIKMMGKALSTLMADIMGAASAWLISKLYLAVVRLLEIRTA
jgi:hypothetical protein